MPVSVQAVGLCLRLAFQILSSPGVKTHDDIGDEEEIGHKAYVGWFVANFGVDGRMLKSKRSVQTLIQVISIMVIRLNAAC